MRPWPLYISELGSCPPFIRRNHRAISSVQAASSFREITSSSTDSSSKRFRRLGLKGWWLVAESIRLRGSGFVSRSIWARRVVNWRAGVVGNGSSSLDSPSGHFAQFSLEQKAMTSRWMDREVFNFNLIFHNQFDSGKGDEVFW